MAIDVQVYIATAMTGKDKAELVSRAERVCNIFKEFGIIPISPVFREGVKSEIGIKLINNDKVDLKLRWEDDKKVIIEKAHVFFWDHAEMKSFGAEREYALARFCLWKPSVMYVTPGTPVSVAGWEDDAIFTSVHEAAKYIVDNWGTKEQRFKWRWDMLKRSFPKWLQRQWYQLR